LTGSSAVGLDATGATAFDATAVALELRVVGIVEDCRVRTKRTVD